jgi:hypothetical protein
VLINLPIKLYMPIAKVTIIRAVKHVIGNTRDMRVHMGSIAHVFSHLLVTGESDKARDEGNIREFLSWLAIRAEPWFVAIGAFLEIPVRSSVATACIRTTVVQLRFHAREKSYP